MTVGIIEERRFPNTWGPLNFVDTAHCDLQWGVAKALYDYLYPKIWGLINDQKHFRKSKKYGVLYSRGFRQHCFYIDGYIKGDEFGSTMVRLHQLFMEGRLKKYVMTVQRHYNDVYLRITPFVYIKRRVINTEKKELVSKYGIYEMLHTMGFNQTLRTAMSLDHLHLKDAQNFYQMTWRYGVRRRNEVYATFLPASDNNNRTSTFIIRLQSENICNPTIRVAVFNIQAYRFVKYIFRIDEAVQRCGTSLEQRDVLGKYIWSLMEGD